MKKILLFSLVVAMSLSSCKKSSDDSGQCAIATGYTFAVDKVTRIVNFTNTSGAEAAQFSWNFGDNTTSTLANPSHTYSAAGTYMVKLSVKSVDGKCVGEVTTSVIVPVNTNTVPGSFTKKAFIEEFTGAWCGYCVDGAYIVETIVAANAGKVIAASVHDGDGMAISLDNTLTTIFANSSYPAALVDRIAYGSVVCNSRNVWQARVVGELSKEAKCGLSLKTNLNATSDSVSVEIKTGFKYSLPGTYKLVTYVVEDDVMGTGSSYDQVNYYSSAAPGGSAGTATHPYYNLPYHITGYKHKQVIRMTVPNDLGDVVSASSIIPGGLFTKSYTIAIGSMNKANLSIVSFVYKVGTSSLTYEVMNVQKVKVGSTQNWD